VNVQTSNVGPLWPVFGVRTRAKKKKRKKEGKEKRKEEGNEKKEKEERDKPGGRREQQNETNWERGVRKYIFSLIRCPDLL